MAHNENAEQSRPCWTVIDPATMPPSGGWFSHAARVDLAGTGLMFVSGQMPLDGDGNVVGVGDLRTQTEWVFDDLSLILADQGATFDDVVNIRTFLTDMSQISEYGSTRANYLVGTLPTSTTVEVSRLVHPDAMVEIDIVAVVGSNDSPPNSRDDAS